MKKHVLFFNGFYVTVWGPESRQKCYFEFIKFVAMYLNISFTDLVYALQVSDYHNKPVADLRAYTALGWVNYYVHTVQKNQPVFLKCDEFLVSAPPSRSSLRVTAPVSANLESTPLDQLTEILVTRRQSQSVGTISKPYVGQWIRKMKQELTFMLQPQILLFHLAIWTIFGFLALPLR